MCGRSARAAAVANAIVNSAHPASRGTRPLTGSGSAGGAASPLPLCVSRPLLGLVGHAIDFRQDPSTLVCTELLFEPLEREADDIPMVKLGADGGLFTQAQPQIVQAIHV